MKKQIGTANLYEVSVYTAYGNTDTCEGRGRQYIIGHFETKVDAIHHGKSGGVQGYAEVKHETIQVAVPLDSNGHEQWEKARGLASDAPKYVLQGTPTQEDIKQQALAKLSPSEIAALKRLGV